MSTIHFKIGDRVLFIAGPNKGHVGTVSKIDDRCLGGAPCPCCGAGVAVEMDDPNVSLGGKPADLFVVGGGALFFQPGGVS